MATNKSIAFYMRISTRNQDIPEGSLKSQRQILEEWRKYKNNIKTDPDTPVFNHVYTYEDVESGESSAKRSEYLKMLADLRRGKFKAIACTSISRLNRNLREFYDLMDLCNEHEVDIISLKENFDTSTAIGRALLKFMLVFYELEREQTAERVKDNRYARAKRGLWTSSTILGYRNSEHHKGCLEPIPEEVEIVNKIFDLYIKTGSVLNTRKLLKAQNVYKPARKFGGNNKGISEPFSDASLRRILTNKVYIGKVEWKKTNKGKRGLPDGEQYEVFEAVWEPIVEVVKFNKVQQIFKENTKHRSNQVKTNKKVYYLTEIIKCGFCTDNPNMMAGSGTSKTGKVYYYYICPKCKKRCNAEKIEKVVLNEMSRLSNEPELLNDIVSGYDQTYCTEKKNLEKRIKILIREEKDILNEADQAIIDLRKYRETDSQLFLERSKQREKQIVERLEKNRENQRLISEKIDEIDRESFNMKDIQLIFQEFSRVYQLIPQLSLRRMIQVIVKNCVVLEKKLEINFSDILLTLPLGEKFALTSVERSQRDSNPQLPA